MRYESLSEPEMRDAIIKVLDNSIGIRYRKCFYIARIILKELRMKDVKKRKKEWNLKT